MSIAIEKSNLYKLKTILQNCKYDKVIIDSVLEGKFGKAYIDSWEKTEIVRLDSGAFTVLAGNPNSASLNKILNEAPIYYITPQSNEWKVKLLSIFGSRITKLPFTDYQSENISKAKLLEYISQLKSDYELKRIDKDLAPKAAEDIGNEYFFENFHSIDDYLERGKGYCIIHGSKIVAAATSMAQCSKAIDIEIEVIPEYRQKGLGTIVGAKLVLHCLENRIEPRWLAANEESEKLAARLMFTKGETYNTFEIGD